MGGSCADLTPTQFHKVLLHFSPTKLELLCCHLRACQLTDELLQALIKKRLRNMLFPSTVPVDGGNFCVTDEGIVDFLLQGDIPMDEEEDPPSRLCGDLRVYNSSPTKDLFKRLVGASSVSLRSEPLRIIVSPARFEEEDLRDFAQHLSHAGRGRPGQLRIYDFPGEQHGAIAAVHLQIVLERDNRLEMIRAQRPNPFFYKSDD